jgi:hypothetical protein
MVENGQVSAEEGIRLLELLGGPATTRPAAQTAGRVALPRRLRIRVTDLGTGQQKVDINLPWSLVSVGMTMGARLTPRNIDIDLDDVLKAVQAGTEGKVMEVVDEDEHELVEIFVE